MKLLFILASPKNKAGTIFPATASSPFRAAVPNLAALVSSSCMAAWTSSAGPADAPGESINATVAPKPSTNAWIACFIANSCWPPTFSEELLGGKTDHMLKLAVRSRPKLWRKLGGAVRANQRWAEIKWASQGGGGRQSELDTLRAPSCVNASSWRTPLLAVSQRGETANPAGAPQWRTGVAACMVGRAPGHVPPRARRVSRRPLSGTGTTAPKLSGTPQRTDEPCHPPRTTGALPVLEFFHKVRRRATRRRDQP